VSQHDGYETAVDDSEDVEVALENVRQLREYLVDDRAPP
jgi:hypothetical protein